MKTHKLYSYEMKAARRLFKWVDRHPYATNLILATAGAVCAVWVFFCYPL